MKKLGLTGKGIGIAVLDTGIAPHIDLKSHICFFQDMINYKTYPYDDNGHGTHVSGIIAGDGTASNGKYCGIAPDCKLSVIKILDCEGNGKKESIIKAMNWIECYREKFNIRIVNISVGTTSLRDNKDLLTAVEHIWDLGLTVVAAAGNGEPGRYSITAPKSSEKIITVGVSDMVMKNPINKPDILAPGYQIISCNNALNHGAYTVKSGTSMATPVITGGIALLLEKYPYFTNYEIKEKLKETAKDLGYPQEIQGWGLFQLQKFLS